MVKIKVKNQVIKKNYALYNSDCCEVVAGLPEDSIGFVIYSPPFADLYSYSDDAQDMGNNVSYKEFFTHFGYLADLLMKCMMPGRVMAVHAMDLPLFKRNGEEIGVKDFTGDIIRMFLKHGFVYHCPRITIWKDPLVTATRTKAISLAHKQLVKDSAICGVGGPDYILAFRKPGENPVRIPHERGLTTYYGRRSIPHGLERYKNVEEQRKNKYSHWIWQQYASPVWFDIRQTRVLPYREAREQDDQRHICPLQLDSIERCMELWSTPGDTVLSPFMGVGSEVFVAVKNGRKGVGVELKTSYYKQAVRNVELAGRKGLEL